VTRRLIAVLAAFAFVLAGCGGSKPGQLAKERAAQGAPCEAAELKEGTAAEQEKLAAECTAQKNHEAATKEAKQEDEAVREGQRLKEEGKAP
jgi:hypothetical protein